MGGIRFCGCGCGYQSEDPFVCCRAKPTQRAFAISHETGRGRGKEGPRVKRRRRVKRSGQNRPVENRAVDRSRGKLTVKKGGC